MLHTCSLSNRLAVHFIFFLLTSLLYLPGKSQTRNDGILYSSLNYAVQLGQYDGVASLKELKQHGNFAVGSQHGLAAELVMLDGVAYRISIDGKATLMPDSATLPFAACKLFTAEQKWTVTKSLTLQQLQAYLDSLLNTNRFSAIKITGKFSSLKYKCYSPQQKPYPPLKETPAKFFDSTNISGTMVGFFTPKSALVLNSPNYHFHFINNALTSGGHVEECVAESITIEADYATDIKVKLPAAVSMQHINLDSAMKQQ